MMQILYAVPFLFVAGLLFIVLSSFNATRRYAITVPAGTIAAAAEEQGSDCSLSR
jgi:hypothetical protein